MNCPRFLIVSLLTLVVTACAEPPVVSTPATTGIALSEQFYLGSAQTGEYRVYKVDPGESLLTVRVYRGGPLASMGHDHIIASRDLSGFILHDDGFSSACFADLSFPVQTLAVDEENLRLEAGFMTQPTAADIEGTRHNMLDKVLDASSWPLVSLAVRQCSVDTSRQNYLVTAQIKGQQAAIPVPTEVLAGNGMLAITGQVRINHSDLGLVPFSVLGGLLQVAEEIDVQFYLTARLIGS